MMYTALILASGLAYYATPMVSQEGPCDFFHSALQQIPHQSLDRTAGEIEWLWDGSIHQGCQIVFVTTDSLTTDVDVPDFDALSGSDMANLGWYPVDSLTADGAGSGVFGITNGDTLCLVRWSQPAYIDDDGEFVQSETLTMTIQCRTV